MTQKEKLAELIGNFTDDLPVRDIRSVDFDEKFADFLLENGVVAMPCKAGDTLYRVVTMEGTAHRPFIHADKVSFIGAAVTSPFGGLSPLAMEEYEKTWFLDQEAAKAALSKLTEVQSCTP